MWPVRSSIPSQRSLPAETAIDLVARWARETDTAQLAAWAGAAGAGAVAIIILDPTAWLATTPSIAAAAAGGWGLATRKLEALDGSPRRSGLRAGLRIAQAAAAATGVLAAVAGFFGTLVLVLGPSWIS